MRRLTLLLILVVLAVPVTAEDAPTVRLVEFDTIITPITALRITKAIDEAEQAGDDLVLIELDTPGGMVDSMEKIVQSMLGAEVPVVVWVGPAGAKAASAGFFILVAADVAAMAPGTRTGAASVVLGGSENRDDDPLLRKANEDVAALLRSIADRRGRDVAAAERAVFDAKSYEEKVALELGLADLIAGDREELLQLLDGREVRRFDGSVVTLATAGASFSTTEFSLRHEFMEVLGTPWVAGMLFFLGLTGIYVEFTNPGVVFPGVAGALCLLLFALSAQVLPISTVGILLIVLALMMFLLEIKVVSYGMLTFGGAVALVIGGWMLIDGPIPALRLPLSMIVPLALAITLLCAFAVRLAVRAQLERVSTGQQGMLAEIANVTQDLDPVGRVFVHGEVWDAETLSAPISSGTRVRIVRVEGMRLFVEPVAPAQPNPAGDALAQGRN